MYVVRKVAELAFQVRDRWGAGERVSMTGFELEEVTVWALDAQRIDRATSLKADQTVYFSRLLDLGKLQLHMPNIPENMGMHEAALAR